MQLTFKMTSCVHICLYRIKKSRYVKNNSVGTNSYKNCEGNIFATFLAKDINTCIRKGEFPDKVKMADITPAFKKGDKHGKSNYRPVCTLPILSKVYEKCLYKQIENKNTLTGPANCKKTTRHHAHLSLCAKSRKTNDAKSRKWPKTSFWAMF